MRTMNIKCPVCQQNHPDMHVKLLDANTATYPCPITGQVVNLTEYWPNGNTMILSPGTAEDNFDDSAVTLVISDTVPFGEETAPSMSFQPYPIKNVIDDRYESMQIAGGGVMSTAVIANPSGNGVLAKWPLGTSAYNDADLGDFCLTFGFKMTDITVNIYSGTNAVLPVGFQTKIQLGVDTFFMLQVQATQYSISYYIPGSVAGTPVLAYQAFYSGVFVGEKYYNGKIDVTGTRVVVSIVEAGALTPARVLDATIGQFSTKVQKVSFSYPMIDWAGGSVSGPSYTSNYPASLFTAYGDVVYYPTLILKNGVTANVVIPADPK